MPTNNTTHFNIKMMELCDLERIRLLHNDDTVLENLTNPIHISEIQQRVWFEKISSSNTSQRYVVLLKQPENYPLVSLQNDFVGVFRVDNLDYLNGSVMIGLDIAYDHRGNGYSYEIYEYFLQHFFLTLRMQRIYLTVLETNQRAYHIYEKLGFIKEGLQRDAIFRNGKYHDCICMSMLRHEYDRRIKL